MSLSHIGMSILLVITDVKMFRFAILGCGVLAASILFLEFRTETVPLAAEKETAKVEAELSARPLPSATVNGTHTVSHARDFPVAVQIGALAWADGDFMNTNLIRRLAHNDLEYKRMVEENGRIFRRQLVYWDETPDVVLQRARVSGEAVDHLTLPALDGRKVQFEITGRDVHPSGLEGMFRGRLAGRPDSFVTLAFYQGRQAFTVLSPRDNLFLDAEAHEPGDVVIKQINPATYVVGVCGVK